MNAFWLHGIQKDLLKPLNPGTCPLRHLGPKRAKLQALVACIGHTLHKLSSRSPSQTRGNMNSRSQSASSALLSVINVTGNHGVLRFHVAMNDVVAMQMLQAFYQAHKQRSSLLFRQGTSTYYIEKVSSF